MFARGLKRKCDTEEEVDGPVAGFRAVPSYDLQRQSLLDMSLVKLQLCHMLVEPNLCRSVLIANTVRQIQQEMSQDGTWRVAAPQGVGPAPPHDRLVSTDILCRSAQERSRPGPGGDSSFPKGFEDGPAPDMTSDLTSSMPAPAPRHAPSSVWDLDSSRESRGSFQKSLDQIFETLDSKSPGSMEDLLSDVDSSYYDLDAVLTGMMGGARAGPCDTLEGLAPLTAAPPGPSCKADLGELDHIVEILVET
ncbi:PREDICTED: cell division cycle-associated protein 4 [Chrysochloris asiatica]|uniref:Cell division cycle-associated protein 4 n=1 Tax=Chrysochloris asiatica TaxID=185453 RepID=A0A9B0T5Q9_CHRAS|nr:PREDICTED: cell division cycle-associated protein 4 [Chrysochloris asiatica]